MEKPVEDIVTIKGVEVTSQDHSKPANLCYICNLPERPGAFSVEKAKKLGLKPGPVVGRIKKGETVVLEDGTTIRPEDVLDPGTKYPPILIIDVTDETYLDSLINHSLWRALESKAYLIIHLASDEVVSSSIYSNFIKVRLFSPFSYDDHFKVVSCFFKQSFVQIRFCSKNFRTN